MSITRKKILPNSRALLFISVLLFDIIIFSYLILDRRLILHDTFYRFTVQYFFLNNVAVFGEIPHWQPYLTHGVTTFFWFGIHGIFGFLSKVFFFCGEWLRGSNSLVLFYLDIFFSRLILLIGVWMLGERYYYKSKWTTAFVSFAVMGSSVWMTQIHFNLNPYYAIPLIIYFLHKFIEKAQCRYFFLSVNLFIMQSLDSLVYTVPMSGLVIFLYFLLHFLFDRDKFISIFKRIKWRKSEWTYIIFSCVFLVGYYLTVKFCLQSGEIIIGIPERAENALVTLKTYLTYGQTFSLWRYIELIWGFSAARDYSLYLGISAVPFLILSLFNTKKIVRILWLLMILLTLITMGTFVSIAFFYAWPLMKYYRHLYLLVNTSRIFVCFLVGFGLDSFIHQTKQFHNKLSSQVFWAKVTLFLALAFLITLILNLEAFPAVLKLMNFPPPPSENMTSLNNIRNNLFLIQILKVIIAFGIFHLFQKFRTPKKNQLCICFLLIFQAFDMLTYHLGETQRRTIPLTQRQYELLSFYETPFHRRRSENLFTGEEREDIIKNYYLLVYSGIGWTTNNLLFKDQLGASLSVLFWQKSWDEYMRVYSGPPNLNNWDSLHYNIIFPKLHQAASKFSGLSADKIQFFSKAFMVKDRSKLAEYLFDPIYTGDKLLISPLAANDKKPPPSLLKHDELKGNNRVLLDYQIMKFSANQLVIKVNNKLSKGRWLFYSDVWHPLSRATVNDQEVSVYKASLGYKAVRIPPGLVTVHFMFRSKFAQWFFRIYGLNAALWLIIIGWMTGKCILTSEPKKKDISLLK